MRDWLGSPCGVGTGSIIDVAQKLVYDATLELVVLCLLVSVSDRGYPRDATLTHFFVPTCEA